jgi:hypothetical protein
VGLPGFLAVTHRDHGTRAHHVPDAASRIRSVTSRLYRIPG